MIKYVTIALYSTLSWGKNYSEIYKLVTKNNPSLPKSTASIISNSIIKVSKKHNIPSRLYAAILMQESAYNVAAKNCRYKNEKCADFGMSQINIQNIKTRKLDIKKLTSDIHYSIEAGAVILSEFKKMYEVREKFWWTRYNSSNEEKREEYKRKVLRFY